MEIRNLKTFLKVAALCNFTKAAKELGYSQSNVSAQIQQLEQEIGVPLFDRIGRTTRLTQFGETLLPYARRLCSAASEMENLLKSEELLGGTVRFGITDSLAELPMEEAILAYHQRFPLVQSEITIDTTANLLEQLRKGLLDAACVVGDPLLSNEWTIYAQHSTPVVVAANPALPIAQKQSVTLSDLAQEKMVLMERDAPYSLRFEQALAQQNLDCTPTIRLQSARAALRLIERGALITVLPLYAVRESAANGCVRILNVPDWEHDQSVQLAAHNNKTLTPQMEGFLEELNALLSQAIS